MNKVKSLKVHKKNYNINDNTEIIRGFGIPHIHCEKYPHFYERNMEGLCHRYVGFDISMT